MAISRTEMQSFFTFIGINVDKKEVKCFKCDKPLYYKNLQYQCDNLHKYSYENVAFKYALHLQDIKNEIADIGACGLQSVDFS